MPGKEQSKHLKQLYKVNMNIGDRVRLLRGTEEGKVINFKGKNMVEIEIDEGFIIPAMMSEVVVISQEENEYFGNRANEPQRSRSAKPVDEPAQIKGIFFVFLPINENDLSLNLMNFTEKDYLYNISERFGSNAKSLGNGKIAKSNSVFVSYFKLDNFDKWPEIFIQLIPINSDLETSLPYFEESFKVKPATFFKSKRTVPRIDKEGYMFTIGNSPKLSVDKLKENFFKGEGTSDQAGKAPPGEPANRHPVIDLHIEHLNADYQEFTKDKILEIQVKKFEYELDKAIAAGCDSIKFIHGIGNGTLRHLIHKRLSQTEHIKYFEDSDKGKFGYGATTVHI